MRSVIQGIVNIQQCSEKKWKQDKFSKFTNWQVRGNLLPIRQIYLGYFRSRQLWVSCSSHCLSQPDMNLKNGTLELKKQRRRYEKRTIRSDRLLGLYNDATAMAMEMNLVAIAVRWTPKLDLNEWLVRTRSSVQFVLRSWALASVAEEFVQSEAEVILALICFCSSFQTSFLIVNGRMPAFCFLSHLYIVVIEVGTPITGGWGWWARCCSLTRILRKAVIPQVYEE